VELRDADREEVGQLPARAELADLLELRAHLGERGEEMLEAFVLVGRRLVQEVDQALSLGQNLNEGRVHHAVLDEVTGRVVKLEQELRPLPGPEQLAQLATGRYLAAEAPTDWSRPLGRGGK